MRAYRAPEMCLLLLYALPGEMTLKERLYQKMLQAFSVLGEKSLDFDEDVSEQTLLRLGCTQQEAGAILGRLESKDVLLQYLRGLERQGVYPVTRISPAYPQRLRTTLGNRAPLVLWCCGNQQLFSKSCISLVGSRQLETSGERFAQQAGRAIGQQGFCYCSGGASGADTVGFQASQESGGCAVIFVADSLAECRNRNLYLEGLRENRVLLVSEGGPDERFSAQRALSRNRLIHAMGEKVLVAQSGYGTGGTWSGTMENLKAGWSPVFVNNAQPENPGIKGLLERGGNPVSMDALSNLEALGAAQLSLL